jgi:uncharacterized membrane protein
LFSLCAKHTTFVVFITLAYMGVGRSIKFMNRNILGMNLVTRFKGVFGICAIALLLLGGFQLSSYNPHDELAVFLPQAVLAADVNPQAVPPLPAPVVRTCKVTANLLEVTAGSNVEISWVTEGFDDVTLNGQVVQLDGMRTFVNIQANTTYTLVATTADGKNNCISTVTVLCIAVPLPPTCIIDPVAVTILAGESVFLSWDTTNAASATLTNYGTVPTAGYEITGPLLASRVYTLTVLGNDGTTITCRSTITVSPVTPLPPACKLEPETKTILAGESAQLSWTTTNAASATLTSFGTVPTAGYEIAGPLFASKVYTLTVLGADGTTVTCTSTITVTPPPPLLPTCTLTPTTQTIVTGGTATLNWTTGNASSTTLTSFGSVPLNGNRTTGVLTASTTYTLTVLGLNGTTITCVADVIVTTTPPPVVPSCDLFTATPSTITRGSASTLTWRTTNAARVVIDNGVGDVTATGTISVSPLSSIEFTLTAFGTGGQQVSCKTTVTVVTTPPPTPLISCDNFTASVLSLPVGGGSTTLDWSVSTNATSSYTVSISPTIGAVSLVGTSTVSISTTTTYTLTAILSPTVQDSCAVTITVAPPVPPNPQPITCAGNVSLTASPNSIDEGDSSTISWSTTGGITAVSFDQGITATGLSGNVAVSPSSDTTYILTASSATTTIACPVTINVETSGGGGGSSSPTCELTVSENKIDRGEQITLRWESTRASDVKIVDSYGKTIISTYGLISDDKEDLLDGSVKVSPTKDTTYTMTAKRGSRDRVCTVKVSVNDSVSVTQVRDQQPLIAGIALSQVPYTGFAAGPILTITFYLLLLAWALYVAYLIVIRRDVVGGLSLVPVNNFPPVPTPEQIRPDVFVSSVRMPEVPPSVHAPINLPVGNPVIGYASVVGVATVANAVSHEQSADEIVTAIENHAHAKKALLSSDAVRHFMGTTTAANRITTLNDVISLAREKYPSEDGWVVVNEKRMQDLCVSCQAVVTLSNMAPYVPTVIPEGSGSLAEAIVTGNIVAAYEMIGHRPMFALADAAADLDALYRGRKGAEVVISTMLQTETAALTDAQIMQMIEALTGALDGVYTDEAAAVKMAIMKAVKVVA